MSDEPRSAFAYQEDYDRYLLRKEEKKQLDILENKKIKAKNKLKDLGFDNDGVQAILGEKYGG